MKQNVFQSTIFRIFAIVIALVLPINIMTLVLSSMVLEKNQEQISREIQSTLDVNVSNFSDTLSRASRKLTYLSISDSDFIALANAANAGASDRGAYLSQVKQSLETVRLDYPWIDMFYFQFPAVDFTICAGYPGIPYQECRDFIQQTAAQALQEGQRWTTNRIGGVDVLFSFQSWNNTNYGVVVNLDRLLDKLELPETAGRSIFFMNTEGAVLTTAGTAFFEAAQMGWEDIQASSRYEVFTVAVDQSNLVLVEVLDWDVQGDNLPSVITLLQWLSILMAVIAIPILLIALRRWVIRPLNRLTKAISRIEQGDLDYRIQLVNDGREFGQINQSFNNMMEQVKSLKIDIYDKELEKKDIQMRYLSQQIQPHFILNAMNIIYSYEPEEYDLIQQMVLCITKYFRYIVKVNASFVTLGQELEHIENYFEIQRARYPGLFKAVVRCDEGLQDALIPPLLVQNFAENSIKHSLQIGNKITIFVHAEYCKDAGDEKMRIRLTDSGAGISDDLLHKIEVFKETGAPQEGLGLGIQNSIERLRHLYNSKNTHITFRRGEDSSGTIVEIALPVYYSDEQREC